MSSSKFASSFAPYTPPPDDPSYNQNNTSSSKSPSRIRPWFPVHASSYSGETSYQSGGVPTFNTSVSGGAGAVEETEGQTNQWETRYGMRVDALAAGSYLLGPISALLLLIIETQNDFVRFHAYQSALLTTPLIALRILVSLLQFPSWFCTIITIGVIFSMVFMAFQAFRDASRNGLARFRLPKIGQLAADWVEQE